MIATAFVERCLYVLMRTACRLIGIVSTAINPPLDQIADATFQREGLTRIGYCDVTLETDPVTRLVGVVTHALEQRHQVQGVGLFAIGLGAILFGTIPACAEDNRWYTEHQVKHGAAVFAQNCAECHGANAEATPDWKKAIPDGKYPPPPLNGTAHAWHHSLDVLRRQIRLGGIPLGGVMPPFKDKLSKEEIDAAIAYFQSKWNVEVYTVWTERNQDSGNFFHKVDAAADDQATRHLRKRFPRLDIGTTEETPVKGVVLIKVGGEYVYLTRDGRHAFVGSLLDLETGDNITEQGKGRDRQPDHYQVLLLDKEGNTEVFAQH